MKNLLYILLLSLASCETIEQISVDQMLPAEVYFPEEIRRVAVIDHPLSSDTLPAAVDSAARAAGISWLKGNTAITAESLAKSLADANYFDEVVICDTVVPASGENSGTMSREEVKRLTDGLSVDMLLTVDGVSMLTQRKAIAVPEWECYRGVADVKVYSAVQAYIPQRSKPLFSVYANDSIYWEEYGATVQQVARMLAPDTTVVRESSEFAGTLPLKYLVPHWTTVSRTIYVGNSASMRDAMVAVRQSDWETARQLWKAEYDKTKSERRKMQLAYNLAIYNEMAGDIEEGVSLAEEAQSLAYKVDKVKTIADANGGKAEVTPDNAYRMTNYIRTTLYLDKLKARKSQLGNLKVQMQRFSDDL
jgi:hypothetical protein